MRSGRRSGGKGRKENNKQELSKGKGGRMDGGEGREQEKGREVEGGRKNCRRKVRKGKRREGPIGMWKQGRNNTEEE